METRSKVNSGLKVGQKVENLVYYFDESEKHKIIQEMLETGCTKREIWRKYTGQVADHGLLIRWMRKLGYDTSLPKKRNKFATNSANSFMDKEDKLTESFELIQLKMRIAELERQLKEAEMKAIAFSTMVDIAEKEFKVSIRKKFNTKP